mmetsp:Transcript_2519/g.6582  ORF Transcript_2519/g.6582 Transcript_2519/m.6582 type:complete len:203 (-) Transcript_2519:201-809(-)
MAATLPGLVVVATLFHVAAAALSPSEEKLALYTTPLRPDMDFRTWVLADDKCSWRGVDCDAQGYVVKLDMQHLDGSLPASFSAFKRLLELRLEYKALRGDMQLPTAWSSLQNLRSLRIPNSSVQGSIPSAWSALKNLRWLDLSGNNLAGTLPWNFGVLTSLLVLDVSKNDITVTPTKATMTTAPSLLYFAVPPAFRAVDPLP